MDESKIARINELYHKSKEVVLSDAELKEQLILRKEYIEVNDKDKQPVMMNPGNQVNLKLTLNLKELKPIANFADELRDIFLV